MKSLNKRPRQERLLHKLIGPEPSDWHLRPDSPLHGDDEPEQEKSYYKQIQPLSYTLEYIH